MTVAPAPISSPQRKPERAPSLMMVTLTGPTGTERRNPLIKPVKAASIKGCWSNMSGGIAGLFFFVVFFFDFVADLAGNSGTDKPIEEVKDKNYRQNDGQNQSPQNHQRGGENNGDNRFWKRAPRAQI